MSTLVLVLATTMTVPANGPAAVSSEIEQGLDVRGRWDGILVDGDGEVKHGEFRGGEFIWDNRDSTGSLTLGEIQEEGSGRFRLPKWGDDLGIYRHEGDRIALCWYCTPYWNWKWGRKVRYPTRFAGGNGHFLLVLRRVRPRE